jgi:hypothetical protein
MTLPRVVFPSAALVLVFVASPAMAGHHHRHVAPAVTWRETRQAIYEQENLIALLEANPQTDDGYKAPLISKARAEAWRLRATLPRPQWRYTTPCCYSRRPIYIR